MGSPSRIRRDQRVLILFDLLDCGLYIHRVVCHRTVVQYKTVRHVQLMRFAGWAYGHHVISSIFRAEWLDGWAGVLAGGLALSILVEFQAALQGDNLRMYRMRAIQ